MAPQETDTHMKPAVLRAFVETLPSLCFGYSWWDCSSCQGHCMGRAYLRMETTQKSRAKRQEREWFLRTLLENLCLKWNLFLDFFSYMSLKLLKNKTNVQFSLSAALSLATERVLTATQISDNSGKLSRISWNGAWKEASSEELGNAHNGR